MTAVVLRQFSGMLPRYSDQLLPPMAATIARNCRLLSGEIQALKVPSLIYDFSEWPEDIRRIFKVTLDTGYVYAPFDDTETEFVRGPLVQDAYNRHYWTVTEAYPRYATGDMLVDDFDNRVFPIGYRLGIPAPTAELDVDVVDPDAPVVVEIALEAQLSSSSAINADLYAPGTGGDWAAAYLRSSSTLTADLYVATVSEPDTLEETRVYVYTFVSEYGEEGAPSPPAIVTGSSLYEWQVRGFETTVEDQADRNITEIYLYRTITGTLGAVEYFRVATMAFGTTEYTDTATNETVSFNPVLQTSNWNEPPEGLQGLLSHPNGFLVGFKDHDLYFSVPYRPHAWPVEYVTSTEWQIVGLGLIGQAIVVLTMGAPYIAAGVRPEAISLVKSKEPNACKSRRGIVSTDFGVYYPGPDGLMLVLPDTTVVNATKKFLSRREWRLEYHPHALEAVKHDTQYVAFFSDTQGFAIDFDESSQLLIELEADEWDHSAMQSDSLTGDVWFVQDNLLRVWNPESGAPVPYLWRSREYDFPSPLNFGAAKITYKDVTTTGWFDPLMVEQWQAFNAERIQYPLNPLNFSILNGARRFGSTQPAPYDDADFDDLPLQYSQPMHRSPLFLTYDPPDITADLVFRVYTDRIEEPVFEDEINDMELIRLPTGFRSIIWQFEVEGTAEIQSIKVAETSKELDKI